MAKKLVAVTGIKHNGEYFPAGEPIDAGKFEKEELKQLHDAGAVKVEGEDDPSPEELAPEKSVNDDQEKPKPEEEKKEAAKPATTSTPTKAATPTKSTSPSK